MILPDSVTVKRAAPTTDVYGNVTSSWTSPTTATYPGRLVQASSFETLGTDRDAVRTSARLYLNASADLRSRDRVTVAGKTWEVVGEPYAPRGTYGVRGYLQADLLRVEG